MALALFDLDDTLLDGDSASLWFAHMVTLGLAEASMLAEEEAMMVRYHAGELQMAEYMAFTLRPLAGQPVARLGFRPVVPAWGSMIWMASPRSCQRCFSAALALGENQPR